MPQLLKKITNGFGNLREILNRRYKQIIKMQETIIAINHRNNKIKTKALQFNIKAIRSLLLITPWFYFTFRFIMIQNKHINKLICVSLYLLFPILSQQ
ncbi:hypothetical protein CKG00_12350 [Morganella morganii]|uniref:Uncharacterized protein n=1 Tax=Morganella morganii TaxID=582 RepID=A0A433ZY68_MORMO|nr:hypothetical protein CKG00_12350 [Morganella morganii]